VSGSPIRAERAWVAWCFAYVIAAVVLCSTDHQSRSGDSRYYSAQAARMASVPAPEWLAPRWGENHYEHQPREYFREHPAGQSYVTRHLTYTLPWLAIFCGQIAEAQWRNG